MKKKVFTMLIMIASLFLLPTSALAEGDEETTDTGSNPTGFEYRVIHPDNQIGESGYLDLMMTPGQKQTVEIKIKNTNDNPLTLTVELNGTKTNSIGVIEWGPSAGEKDPSLKYAFEDIVKAPAEITVEARTEKSIPIEITMPKDSYDGVIAGGIRMMVKDEGTTDPNATIVNRYASLVGVLLKETETIVKPELKLNKVYGGLSNYRGSVFINYSNINAVFIGGMSIEAEIFRKGSDEVLYDKKQSGMAMAPNSQMTFPISMEGDEMKAGDYRAHILIQAGKEKWEWTEEFTITKEEADKFNQADVGVIQERGIDWPLIATIVGGVAVIGIGLFVGLRVMNKKKQAKALAERKQKMGVKNSTKKSKKSSASSTEKSETKKTTNRKKSPKE
ncbi:hypothetical protein IGI37_003341 [Enterococcus sp. AZ194]|uniref:DUF916 and DUF3324 domain-containing protein n=1 Tax=Enterococcus sp. AZ194 TaxID=2774629 RepID=UPI003F25A4DD